MCIQDNYGIKAKPTTSHNQQTTKTWYSSLPDHPNLLPAPVVNFLTYVRSLTLFVFDIGKILSVSHSTMDIIGFSDGVDKVNDNVKGFANEEAFCSLSFMVQCSSIDEWMSNANHEIERFKSSTAATKTNDSTRSAS
jgi:hypothetical protein